MILLLRLLLSVGGTVASWLVSSTPEQAVLFRALAGDIMLCFWARHFTLTVPLHPVVFLQQQIPSQFVLICHLSHLEQTTTFC